MFRSALAVEATFLTLLVYDHIRSIFFYFWQLIIFTICSQTMHHLLEYEHDSSIMTDLM